DRGGNPSPIDLIACSARASAVVTIGIDIDLIAGGARGQARNTYRSSSRISSIEIALHHACVAGLVRDGGGPGIIGAPGNGGGCRDAGFIDQSKGSGTLGATGIVPVGFGNHTGDLCGGHGHILADEVDTDDLAGRSTGCDFESDSG